MKNNKITLIFRNLLTTVVLMFFVQSTFAQNDQNIQASPNKGMSNLTTIQTFSYKDVSPTKIVAPQETQINVQLAQEAQPQPQLTPQERAQAMTPAERAITIEQLNGKLAQATPGSEREQKLLNMIAYLEGLN